MSTMVRAFAIGYCSACVDREQAERLITTNESQWLIATMACRECASYEVDIEVNYAK